MSPSKNSGEVQREETKDANQPPSKLEKSEYTPFEEYCSIRDGVGCEAYEDLARNLDEKVHRWIRVEAREDEALAGIKTREDVMLKIEQVTAIQNAYGPAQLYDRYWEKKANSAASLHINGDGPRRPASFSVLQFNTLAEGLSSGPNVKTPFPVENQKEDPENKKKNDAGYGGLTQVKSPEVCMDFKLRRWRVLEVILGLTYIHREAESTELEGAFDVLVLQEVDRFHGFFAPLLRIFGYAGIFFPKVRSPGVPLGYYSDGCALFWKTDAFELVSEKRVHFKVGNQVMILAELKHKSTGTHILVVVTHLKAQKSETNEKIRRAQVDELLKHVEAALRKSTENGDLRVLIAGDFNADPPAQLPFPDSCIRRVLDSHLTGERQPMRLQSAYEVDPPAVGLFTTWKTRGAHTVRRIIDYIFHSEKLTCSAILSVPSEEELEDSKLPGLRYPSDHLMIAAEFEIAEKKTTE